VIGVLEYINRRGEPPFEPFSPAEMDRAASFAEVIASLVHAYETAKIFRDLGERMLEDTSVGDVSSVRDWLRELRDSPEHREMIDLAIMIREVAGRGDAERQLCMEMLESIVKFSDAKSETSYLSL
jgi:hypothetical protein